MQKIRSLPPAQPWSATSTSTCAHTTARRLSTLSPNSRMSTKPPTVPTRISSPCLTTPTPTMMRTTAAVTCRSSSDFSMLIAWRWYGLFGQLPMKMIRTSGIKIADLKNRISSNTTKLSTSSTLQSNTFMYNRTLFALLHWCTLFMSACMSDSSPPILLYARIYYYLHTSSYVSVW